MSRPPADERRSKHGSAGRWIRAAVMFAAALALNLHDLRERSIVLVGRSPWLEPYLGARDSLPVTPELSLYVLREPMRLLLPAAPAPRTGSSR